MKRNILIFLLAGFFVLLSINFLSAISLTLSHTPKTLTKTGESATFTITANGSVNFTTSFPQNLIIKDNYNEEVVIQITNSSNLTNVTSANFSATVLNISKYFNLGEYSTTLSVYAENASNSSDTSSIPIQFNFENTDFCKWDGNEANETGDLKVDIRDRDISVVKGFGDNEEWYPLDEIEVKVKVENRNNTYDIDDIVVEWGLFNKKTKEWTIEVNNLKDFNLKKRDEKTLTFNFKLEDLDEDFEDLDNGDFVFYVRATGEVDADTRYYSCASDSKPISIQIERDFVVLNDLQLPETVSCGEEVQIMAKVWNIGDRDQDNVSVAIYNKELGISKKVVIGDIDAFENEELNTLIKIPKDVEEKYYTLTFYVYDEDNEVYEDRNDDKAEFFAPIKVQGGCIINPKLTMIANLISGGKAGQEMVVKAVLTNKDSKTRTFEMSAGDYNRWAELIEISPKTISLDANESGEILFTFNVNKDVSGEQTFNILINSDNKLLVTQPVSVSIEKSGFNFSRITGKVISKNSWYLWGIGIVNIVLIILIIFFALRLARKE